MATKAEMVFRHSFSRLGHHAILIAVASIMFFANLGGASLWDRDEGRNATAAFEMLESGNWIVPTFNGSLRVDKPALLYWLQAAAYHAFGVNEFSARLPSAVAALLTVLLCYELGRRMFNPATGLLAGLIAAGTPLLCAAARFANPDSLLNFFTVLTLFLFWRGYSNGGKLHFVAMGASSGFAMLAKGPVGFVLPTAIIVLFLLWNRQLKLFLRPGCLAGCVVFGFVALPWYIWVAADTKADFLRGFFLTHNVNRFLSPMENHAGSPFYYLLVWIAGALPWSIFLGMACWYGAWSVVRRPWSVVRKPWANAMDSEVELLNLASEPTTDHGQRTTDVYRLLCCWIVLYLAFFSVAATKLPNYILPIAVPTAILIARFLDRWRRGLVQPPVVCLYLCLLCFAFVGLGIGLGLAVAGGAVELPFVRGRRIPGLELWAWLGILPLLAAAGGWWFLRHKLRGGLIACLALGSLCAVGTMAAWASAALNKQKAPQPLVEAAGAQNSIEDIRIAGWQLEYLPSLNFYTRREVIHLQNERDLAAMLKYPLRVYVFTSATAWDAVSPTITSPWRIIGRHPDMYGGREVIVVTNR